MTRNIHPVVQEKLQETFRDKAAKAQSAEAKEQDLGAINISLKILYHQHLQDLVPWPQRSGPRLPCP